MITLHIFKAMKEKIKQQNDDVLSPLITLVFTQFNGKKIICFNNTFFSFFLAQISNMCTQNTRLLERKKNAYFT